MTNTRSGSVFMFNGGSGMRSRSPVLGDKKVVPSSAERAGR